MVTIVRRSLASAAVATLLVVGACGDDDGSGCSAAGGEDGLTASASRSGDESADLDPADFSTTIDNPYLPLPAGSRWVYRETGPKGEVTDIVVTVDERTRTLANGIEAVVVRDEERNPDGSPIEIAEDWYAQDTGGNVWFLGNVKTEYEDDEPVTSRFEAGVDGAQGAIVMPADPRVGETYRQTYVPGEDEDQFEVLGLDEAAEPVFGRFDGVMMIRKTSPTEPELVDFQFIAPGVGQVLGVETAGGDDRNDLIAYELAE
jgi:hypothetical protein